MHNGYFEEIGTHGYMTPLTDEEQKKDDVGFTHPNLHRRITETERETPEVEPRDYKVIIQGLNSIRTTIKHVHDEESTTSEIP